MTSLAATDIARGAPDNRDRSPDLALPLAVRLARVGRAALRRWEEEVIGHQGKAWEWEILSLLGVGWTGTQTELAEAIEISPSALSHYVDDLERRELIHRSTPDGDRRARRIRLTPAGSMRLRRLTLAADAYERLSRARLAPAERDLLEAALDLVGSEPSPGAPEPRR